MNRGARMALDQKVRYAVVREEHRCRQPDKTAADNQDRDVSVQHRVTRPSARIRAGRVG
jgi:hypothetical protein